MIPSKTQGKTMTPITLAGGGGGEDRARWGRIYIHFEPEFFSQWAAEGDLAGREGRTSLSFCVSFYVFLSIQLPSEKGVRGISPVVV